VRRGKGFALDFGRAHLAERPPQTVVILDADCRFQPHGLERLVAGVRRGRPAQAVYLLDKAESTSPLVQISNFAFLVKNLVRNRALMRLGGCALLTGTGMAFPWATFARAPLATADIVEDLGLTLCMIRGGTPPILIDRAQVRSTAASTRDTAAQRTRWEHGFLAKALRYGPALLWSGVRSRKRSEVALGLHLLVPPLALLFLLSGATLLTLLLVHPYGDVAAQTLALGLSLTIASLATLLARWQVGSELVSISALLSVPFYIAWKMPLYVRFLIARETRWIRTGRGNDTN